MEIPSSLRTNSCLSTRPAVTTNHGPTPRVELHAAKPNTKVIIDRFPDILSFTKVQLSPLGPGATTRNYPDNRATGHLFQGPATAASHVGTTSIVPQSTTVGSPLFKPIPVFVPILLFLFLAVLYGIATVIYLIVTRVRPPHRSVSPSSSDAERVNAKKRRDSKATDIELREFRPTRPRYISRESGDSSQDDDTESLPATGVSTAMEWPTNFRQRSPPHSALETLHADNLYSSKSAAPTFPRPGPWVQTEDEWLRRRQCFEESLADEESLLPHVQSKPPSRSRTAVSTLSRFLRNPTAIASARRGRGVQGGRHGKARRLRDDRGIILGILESIDGLVDELAGRFVTYVRDDGGEEELVIPIGIREREADVGGGGPHGIRLTGE